MPTYAVCNQDGELISVGTVLPDPMPEELNFVELNGVQIRMMDEGALWDCGLMEPIPVPPTLSNIERFQNLPPEKANAILSLSGGLLMQAGVIWQNTYAMPNGSMSKAALRPIADVLLEAALPLVTEES